MMGRRSWSAISHQTGTGSNLSIAKRGGGGGGLESGVGLPPDTRPTFCPLCAGTQLSHTAVGQIIEGFRNKNISEPDRTCATATCPALAPSPVLPCVPAPCPSVPDPLPRPPFRSPWDHFSCACPFLRPAQPAFGSVPLLLPVSVPPTRLVTEQGLVRLQPRSMCHLVNITRCASAIQWDLAPSVGLSSSCSKLVVYS